VLVNTSGQPWGTGFDASLQKAYDAALELLDDEAERAAFDELHFHDLRGTAATTFYAAGITDPAEIAEIMAWSPKAVEQLLRKYVLKNAITKARIARLNANAA